MSFRPPTNQHEKNKQALLFYEEDHLTMKTTKPIPAGSEIFNDYGPLPRSDLLRRYGYITPNYAQYDVVEIPFDLFAQLATQHKLLPAHADRIEYLDEQGVVDTGYDVCASDPYTLQESVSPELIVLVESLLLPADEFERLRRKEKLPKPEKMTAKAADMLLQLVKARTAQYATSLEQDRAADADADADIDMDVDGGSGETLKQRRYAMAKAVRIGEKELLQKAEQALHLFVQEKASESGSSKRQASEEGARPGKKQRS